MKQIFFFLIIATTGFSQNIKISDMTSAVNLTGTVYIPIVQGGANKKWSINDLPLPPAAGGTGINSLGTGVATALGINVGSAGAPVLFNGAGGSPSSLTLPNATGLPISTGLSGGTTNRIPYFTSSTALATSSVLQFDGTIFTLTNQSSYQSPVSGSLAQFVGTDANPLRLTFDTHNNSSASGTAFMIRRSRGTASSPSALSSGDVIAAFSGRGYGTSQYAAASTGLINIKANQTFTNTANGTYISFDATPDGSLTASEVFRMGGSGQFGIGGATYGSSGNVFQSGGSSAAPTWGAITLSNSASVTGVLPVANGGTNASSASITAFNNITGYTASGATGTTSTNLVFSTSPTIVTPTIAKIANLTSNGLVKTSGSDGTLGTATAGTDYAYPVLALDLSSDVTAGSGTGAQDIFVSGNTLQTSNTVTVTASTYDFILNISLTGLSGSPHTVSVYFNAGSATASLLLANYVCANTNQSSTNATFGNNSTLVGFATNGSNSVTTHSFTMTGTITFSGAGTFQPQISQNTNGSAFAIKAGSSIKLTKH